MRSNRIPTRYTLVFDVDDGAGLAMLDLGTRSDFVRRDVLLGGEGNDVLWGGPGEDWIFGGLGNDVLAGGADRQASDLVFGGEGDDLLQLVPDALPFLVGTEQTYIPTQSDELHGGPGDDRVLLLGGDLDAAGRPVPDFVALRYNYVLQRYELTSLVWDIANQEFVQSEGDTPVFEQYYAFYQAREVEGTLVDTRAGDDVVHADPEFRFPNVDSEWGIDRGNLEQGAVIAALEIRGGSGADRLYGGVLGDIIDGGPGADVILGGPGDDRIVGGGGADLLFGNGGISPDVLEVVRRGDETAPNDEYGFAAALPSLTRASGDAAPGVDESVTPQPAVPGLEPASFSELVLSFHLGDPVDWYVIETPQAMRSFGPADTAALLADMIEVVELLPVNERLMPLGQLLPFSLFAAELTSVGGEPTFLPVEEASGVPEYYLLRIENPEPTRERYYGFQFGDTLGQILDIEPADGPDLAIASDTLGDRAAAIPLGDLNGDGLAEFIAVVHDNVVGNSSAPRSTMRVACSRHCCCRHRCWLPRPRGPKPS